MQQCCLLRGRQLAAPGRSHGPSAAVAALGRRRAVVVHANKLIKANNAPKTGKKGGLGGSSSTNPPKKAQYLELNVDRLCVEPDFLPERAIGPVEVAAVSGKGRGVVAKEDVTPGRLLFVSQPIAGALTGPLGQQLQPQDLLQHWQAGKQVLTAADRYKLSLLHHPGGSGSSQRAPPTSVSFKDFSDDKASSKAKKAAASAKGFGAGGGGSSSSNTKAKASGGGPGAGTAAASAAAAAAASAAASAAAELSGEQLGALLRGTAYGDDHLDGALTLCRREQQHSIVGVWPELALLNHSCAPNTAAPVLVRDRLLLRAAAQVPAGGEATTSYLGLAGGMPAQQRRQLLQQAHGFACGCDRCKLELEAPAEVQATLQAMHEWASGVDVAQLLTLMASGDTAAVQALHDEAAGRVGTLEQQLQQQGVGAAAGWGGPLAEAWLRASAYATYALLWRTADWLSGLRDLRAARELAGLVRVFAPYSEPHLLLLADSATRAAEAARAPAAAAAAAGGTAGQGGAEDRDPEDAPELALQRFVRAVALRYGEPRQLDGLSRLAGAVPMGLGSHWLGLTDLTGELGLQQIMNAATVGGAQEQRRKVELNLQQLEALSVGQQQEQQQQQG